MELVCCTRSTCKLFSSDQLRSNRIILFCSREHWRRPNTTNAETADIEFQQVSFAWLIAVVAGCSIHLSFILAVAAYDVEGTHHKRYPPAYTDRAFSGHG